MPQYIYLYQEHMYIDNLPNGEYNLDITDNIEKIIKWIPDEETTVKRKLTRLYTYQQKLQHVIDQYPTNLKAIVTYRIWY